MDYTCGVLSHHYVLEVIAMVQTVLDYSMPPPATQTVSPYAPAEWSLEKAVEMAEAEGLVMTEEHVKVLLDLQDYFFHHAEHVNLRELRDALEEEYHIDSGIKHLHELFPGGPIAQGCRLAGLEVPAYARDTNFGTVM